MASPTRQQGTFPPQPLAPRIIRHSWTNDELNLIAYHRGRRLAFEQIQRKWLPSLTKASVIKAYFRLSAEERAYRESLPCGQLNTHSNSLQAEHVTHPRRRSKSDQSALVTSRPDKTHKLPRVSSSIGKKDNQSGHSTNISANRYNLRPNRPLNFQKRKPRFLVDRLRFPYFFKSYRIHKHNRTPDTIYVPPSRSPTPDPSDRSPSAVSSVVSEVSSLELFGLEARSPPP
jgi:hypothetical protein